MVCERPECQKSQTSQEATPKLVRTQSEPFDLIPQENIQITGEKTEREKAHSDQPPG
jgi:hypothetical protein